MIQVMCDRCGETVENYSQLEFTKLSSAIPVSVENLPAIHLCDVCLDELMFNHGYGKNFSEYSQEKLPLE